MLCDRLQCRYVSGSIAKAFFYGTMLCLLFCSLACRICWGDAISPAMRADDLRLQRRVTVRSPHIQVGELLERISRQAGVTITADDWSTAGSDDVAVSLSQVPLADAMNAVWSLFSYQNAEWDWSRSGANGAYAYRLSRPADARLLAERLRGQVQSDFEGQAQKLIDALGMPQDQLREASKNDSLLNSLLNDGRVGPGMNVFADLPPELQQHILQGGQEYSASVSDLPANAQSAINRMWTWENDMAAMQSGRPTNTRLIPEHTQIKIFAARTSGMIAPALFLDTGQGSGQYCGGAFLDADWRKKMDTQWTLPGDAVDNPANNRAPTTSTQPALAGANGLSCQLLNEADVARVPLIARIPATLDVTASVLPTHIKLATFLKQSGMDPLNLDHKWRDNILLVTCQSWFVDAREEARVPWSEVARLRDAEAKSSDGFLSLSDLDHSAYLLTPAQLHGLSEWFPVMDSVVEWRDFMAYLDQSPDYLPHLMSASGDLFGEPQALVPSRLDIAGLLQTHQNLRLRLRYQGQTWSGRPAKQVMVEVLDDADGKLLAGNGFGYLGHEYASRLRVTELSALTVAAH